MVGGAIFRVGGFHQVFIIPAARADVQDAKRADRRVIPLGVTVMKKALMIGAAAVAAAISASTAAGAATIDFSGSMTGAGIVTPNAGCAPIPFQGTITGAPGTSDLGAFTYSHTVCTQAGVGPVIGNFVIDFGVDQFFGTLSGRGTADETPGLFDLVLNYTITGGTGRFLGETGDFVGSGTANPRFRPSVVSLSFAPPVPEPGTWALMLVGFGAIGMAMRRRRTEVRLAQLA